LGFTTNGEKRGKEDTRGEYRREGPQDVGQTLGSTESGPLPQGKESLHTKMWHLRHKGPLGAQGHNTVTPQARGNQHSPTMVAVKP